MTVLLDSLKSGARWGHSIEMTRLNIMLSKNTELQIVLV